MDGTDESETETGEVDTAVGAYEGSFMFEQEGAPYKSRSADEKNESAEYRT